MRSTSRHEAGCIVSSALKPIVITGARGYIGSALTKRIAGAGQPLRLVSRAVDQLHTEADSSKIDHVSADLSQDAAWFDLIAGVGAIVHLSSRTDLRAAEADPAGDDFINIEPVRALIRAARSSGTRPRVVFASTVTIVGIQHDNPVDEKTPDYPCSVYDQHKLACESLLRAATVEGVVRACSLRLSNVYGYGRTSSNANRGILNSMMRRAANGDELTIYGDGLYERDFTHLEDVVDAFCSATTSDRICDGSHYVIATGQGHTLLEAFDMVAQQAFSQTGRRIGIRHVLEPMDLQPIERRNFIGNSSLFQKLTGWRAKFDLKAGIRDYLARAASHPEITAGQ